MQELFDAIAAGDAARVRELVGADATLAGCRDEQGVSARLRAHDRGDSELVAVLVDSGPELDVFEAAALGAEERLEALLAHDPACASARAGDGRTPLALAAASCHPGAVALLLEAGAEPRSVDPEGACPEVGELLRAAQETSSTP